MSGHRRLNLGIISLDLASADVADAAFSNAWKDAASCASASYAEGLAAIAAIATELDASAANAGSEASARKLGFLTSTSNASVCISFGIAVSPS